LVDGLLLSELRMVLLLRREVLERWLRGCRRLGSVLGLFRQLRRSAPSHRLDPSWV
jgi:hypothetical protein